MFFYRLNLLELLIRLGNRKIIVNIKKYGILK